MNKTYFYRRSEDKVVSDVATKVTLPKLDSIKVQNLGGEVCQIEFDNDIDDTESITLSSLDGGYNSIELNFGPEYINMKTTGEISIAVIITGVRAVKAEPDDETEEDPIPLPPTE